MRWRAGAAVVLLAVLLPGPAAVGGRQDAAASGDRVVLVTLDGARREEIFGGLDLPILTSTLKEGLRVEDTESYRRFWAPTPDQRRRRLMPFFWQLLSDQGSIVGNWTLGSEARLSNTRGFSYPGYAEILLGEAHDAEITSNDRVQNPFPTVLEFLRARLNVSRDKVATFASWIVFNEIAEHTAGATLVNAGPEDLEPAQRTDIALLNRLQHEAHAPWDGIRLDAFTFRLSMAHLAASRPNVLYVAFDETDDWAHDGRYDRVLDAYARIDSYLEQLWTWLQDQPEYRGRTHLLITTDHGRGRTVADWRRHGADVPGAGSVWIALVSPRMAQRGEWRDRPPVSTSQIAATLAGWLGFDWNAERPKAGQPLR